MDSIWQREQAYRRRLYILTPVAAVLVTLLFFTSDRIPYREIEQRVGWEGEMRILPEITIITENDDESSFERQFRVDAMTSVNLDLAETGDVAASKTPVEEKPKDDEVQVATEDYDVRTVQRAREVSYSEDYVILQMVEPEYPPEELAMGIESNVTVELFVNERGRVVSATVLSSDGRASFEDASLDAVRQFVFQPPVREGHRTSMWIKFRIKFRIFS
jgi:TonB family protein